jgi:hypothetical protein
MSMLGLLPFVLYALLQTAPVSLLKGDVLNPDEKAKLSAAQKVDERIQVYHSASKRMQQSITVAVSGNDFSNMPDALNRWVELLSGSVEDIDANIKPKKKSKALIRYEIQVRQALTSLKGYKAKAPIDQQDVFDSKLSEAESIRKRFVEIIFR